MARKLTVYGGIKGGRLRHIVAAPTKKRAAELFGVSLHVLNGWFSPTGNAGEVSAAMAQPETVLVQTDTNSRVYVVAEG